MVFVYFLKNKSDVVDCFKEFKKMVENQKDCKIKFFRTDNGGEFCSSEMEQFLRKSGIVHQTTNAYTPEQNGLIERMNRSIVEKAKCLIFDADLDSKFWAEAVNTAVYLKNRSVAAGLKDKTPYEMWNKKKPDLSNIRIFGSTVMVHVPKANRTKWQKKSERMILMGFSETTKGFRVFNPKINNITTSRDVIIMEDTSNVQIVVKSDSVGSSTDKMFKEENALLEDDSIENRSNDENYDEAQDSDTDYVPDRVTMEETTNQTERQPRRTAMPQKFDDYVTYMCTTDDLGVDSDPVTTDQALSGPDKEQWRSAMEEEYESFIENSAWEITEKREGASVVDCKWVFKKKKNSDGSVRYRARLVAKGYTQKSGTDYDETFSPVVRHSTLRLLIALSVKLDLTITHLDIMTGLKIKRLFK